MIEVKIKGHDYELCRDAACNMWCNKNPALINTEDDKFRSERIGYLGEMAFGKKFHLQADLCYRKHGNKKDFVIFDKIKVDVKNAREFPKLKSGYVQKINKFGKPVKLKSDLYVFSYLAEENNNEATIILVGYEYRRIIEKCEVVKCAYGGKSYIIPYKKLFKIEDLLKLHQEYNAI